jgi:hypothetical protein
MLGLPGPGNDIEVNTRTGPDMPGGSQDSKYVPHRDEWKHHYIVRSEREQL